MQKGDWGGFSGSLYHDTGGAVMFNLCTNPQEDVNVGIRHIPATVPLMGATGAYMADLMEYPPQFKIGFVGNNPAMYDLAPEARQAMQKLLEENGVGRPPP